MRVRRNSAIAFPRRVRHFCDATAYGAPSFEVYQA
jgi:hypothetical protein